MVHVESVQVQANGRGATDILGAFLREVLLVYFCP